MKDLEKNVKDVDSTSDAELEDGIEEVVTLPVSDAGSRHGSQSEASTISHQDTTTKKIIRFKDGDPDNPDNWRQVLIGGYVHFQVLTDARSKSCTPFSWLS